MDPGFVLSSQATFERTADLERNTSTERGAAALSDPFRLARSTSMMAEFRVAHIQYEKSSTNPSSTSINRRSSQTANRHTSALQKYFAKRCNGGRGSPQRAQLACHGRNCVFDRIRDYQEFRHSITDGIRHFRGVRRTKMGAHACPTRAYTNVYCTVEQLVRMCVCTRAHGQQKSRNNHQ